MNPSPRRLPFAGPFVFGLLLSLMLAFPARALIGTNYQMQLGNPGNAAADPSNHAHYLIQRTVETIDYSDELSEPNWVSWDLTAADIGSSGRSSSFYTDTNLPADFYHVSTDDYTDSGYSRGHMCPSEDRTDNTNDNKMVFFMSNIIPQTQDNNGGPWAGLENYCQSLAQAGNELLITCGPSGFEGPVLEPGGKVSIPDYTWKIAVVVPPGSGMAVNRITVSNRVIAIKVPNITGISGIPWTNYITSVNQIQADTGLTFFTALPPSVAAVFDGLVDGTPAPVVSGFSPNAGAPGDTVVITGSNLLAASAVRFNGVAAAAFTANSSLQITATVPGGAATGPISVVTPGGIAASVNSFGSGNSGPPAILTQPANQQANPGSAVTFTVQVAGNAPVYQWWKDGVALADGAEILGSASSQLSLNPVATADAGSYWVIVTNLSGSVTSSIALLALNTNPPAIVTQPANLSLVAGQNATFSVTASGTAPLAYFWQRNGTNIPGANQAAYTRSNVQPADAGNYAVVVTNNYGSVTSLAATLTVAVSSTPGLIAQWNFDATNSAASPPPSLGAGTAALVGGATASFATGSANDTNAANSAWNTTTYPAQASGNKTRGVQFNVSTLGYRNVVISWDERTSNTGSKYYRLQYSTNGTTFVEGPVTTITSATVFQSQTNSLAGLPGVDNNASFAFRIVAEFESTAIQTANAAYDTASTSSYGTSGTVRYDLMTVSGSVIPANIAATLSNPSYGPGSFQFNVSGATGSTFIIQSSTDLSLWTPLLTNSLPFVFTDTNLGNAAARFYRAVYSP